MSGYYDARLAQCDRAVQDGFITPRNWVIVIADTDPAALLARVLEQAPHEPPVIARRDVQCPGTNGVCFFGDGGARVPGGVAVQCRKLAGSGHEARARALLLP